MSRIYDYSYKVSRTYRRPREKERKPLAKHTEKDYFCTVVSEDVKISLKKKPSISLKFNNEIFVRCNQDDCQYVDLNQSPCPLHLDLFAEEIEKREEKRRDRRMEF